jgi:hypothetical protein
MPAALSRRTRRRGATIRDQARYMGQLRPWTSLLGCSQAGQGGHTWPTAFHSCAINPGVAVIPAWAARWSHLSSRTSRTY